MTQLALELSQLEVEPIDLQEVESTQEQNRNLETLTVAEGKNDVLTILTLSGALPAGIGDGGACGSCATCAACHFCISCNCISHCIVN